MQATNENSRKFYPDYIDKVTIFFTPRGEILLKLGNRYVETTTDEVREFFNGRLAQYTLFVELYNRQNGGSHDQSF